MSPKTAVYPLSYVQQGLWIQHRQAPQNVAYHTAMTMRILSEVKLSALRQTFQTIVERQAVLRTIFYQKDGQPVQQILAQQSVAFAEIDATGWDESLLRASILAAHHRPYDLASGPLFRVDLFTQAPDQHVLLMGAHHLVMDGKSWWKLLEEVDSLYPALCEGQVAESPMLGSRYVDYIARQNEILQRKGKQFSASWQKQLANVPPLLQLPTDYVRPPIQHFNGASEFFCLSAELSEALNSLASSEKVTLYVVLLASFQAFLHRYSRQKEFVIGTPMDPRIWEEFKTTFGCFVNLIPLRADLSDNPTFKDFLRQGRQTVFSGILHKEYPFPLLVQQLDLPHSADMSPLVQVLFNYPQPEPKLVPFLITVPDEEQNTAPIEWAGLTIAPFGLPQQEGGFDLTLEMMQGFDALFGVFKYNPDLFKAETIQRMVAHFQTLLAGIVANPNESIAKLPLLTEAERHKILVSWNDQGMPARFTATDDLHTACKCVHQLFEQQVARTPEATAVIFADQVVTYHELNVRANQLAHKLQSLGVRPNSLVGLCVENSLEMIIGLLGILKAGGAYVPLSPAYPPQRLRLILESADLSVLLTQQHLRQSLTTVSGQVLCLDSDWAEIASQKRDNPETVEELPSKLVYVIFTSGSTGQPKCTGVYHEGFTNLVCWFVNQFGLSPTDKVLVTSSFSFDLTQKNFFAPLLVGGQLHLSADAPMGYKAMRKLISKHKITWLNCTPSAFYPFIDSEDQEAGREQLYASLSSLRYLFLGGEPISMSRLRPWLQSETCHTTVVNTYGPTECTDVVASYTIAESDVASDDPIPIGQAISNVNLYILNKELQPMPINVPGDLYIGGICVGAGYLNDAQQTNEKFVPNPFTPKEQPARLYKTGDLARWRADGNIEFLGRSDYQVKIRGFRIELGEIETLLSQHPAVRESIVIVHKRSEGHSEQLVAILVPQEAGLEPDTIRSYLKQKLSDYMVPSLFVILDNLPLTPNGKVDRRVLSELIPHSPELMGNEPPRNKLERELVQMWETQLNVHPIGIQDNFFELGGNSLSIIRFLDQLEKQLGEDLGPVTIFRHPTIEQLANFIKSQH